MLGLEHPLLRHDIPLRLDQAVEVGQSFDGLHHGSMFFGARVVQVFEDVRQYGHQMPGFGTLYPAAQARIMGMWPSWIAEHPEVEVGELHCGPPGP
eukprot:3022183-Alexandrium_andersonii.AAC.1